MSWREIYMQEIIAHYYLDPTHVLIGGGGGGIIGIVLFLYLSCMPELISSNMENNSLTSSCHRHILITASCYWNDKPSYDGTKSSSAV